jgi:methionyl-tRNA formyltransferase
MRLVMMATGPFAVPTHRGLYETRHRVVGLVTGPLRPQTGGRPLPPNPHREIALSHDTPIFDPECINTAESRTQLARFDADLLIVCDYGQILSVETLATARLGGINLHASLLPRYRGAAPINWALYHGERETGITVIHMTPKVDAGPCIAQARLQIDPDEDAVQLEARLAEAGAWLVRRTLDAVEEGRMEALPQDPALASKAPRLKKTDGQIDWTRPAQAIRNQVRALEPWPKTYTYWHRPAGQPLRLIPGLVAVSDRLTDAAPGTVLEAAEGRLVIAAGQGAVILHTIQPAGKRMFSIEEFLRGYHVRAGERFGNE